ncbi:hypothetical protein PSEUDO8Z_60051 [Pseudomonas sp. 8Z]|nr:hypothetical protein PSEUDO8Z_60051 [Pseudomonas sp. 8Z]
MKSGICGGGGKLNSVGRVLLACCEFLGEKIFSSGAIRGGPKNTVRMQNKITALMMVLYCFGVMFFMVLLMWVVSMSEMIFKA